MIQRRQIAVILALALLLPALAFTAGHGEVLTLDRNTTLHTGPEGEPLALLPSGVQVDILERKQGWMRVRLEGWVPDSQALARNEATVGTSADTVTAPPAPVPAKQPAAGSSVPAPPPAAPAEPAVSAGSPATDAGVEGRAQLKTGRRKARPLSGAEVFLLAGEPGPELTGETEDERQRLEQLQAEAADLKRRADVAMQTGSFTQATAEHDRLMRQHARRMEDILALLAARHGRHAAYVRSAAVDQAVADDSGWFTLAPVAPGSYTLYLRVVRDDMDVEWLETVQVNEGMARVILDNSNVRGLMR